MLATHIAAFKVAGRKRVTQSVNIYDTDTILDEDLLEVTLKVSWLNHRSDRRGEHKPIAWIAVSFQMVDLRLTVPCELLGECRKQRNGADGVSGFRLIDLQNCLVWRIMIGIFDTVQSLRDADIALSVQLKMDIFPRQTEQLPLPYTGIQCE